MSSFRVITERSIEVARLGLLYLVQKWSDNKVADPLSKRLEEEGTAEYIHTNVSIQAWSSEE